MQKSHEERAQSAAQKAADELHAPRRDQVREEARGVADAAMGKAGETKDAAADRARGAMDAAADKARGVRDAAADRTTDNKAGDAESEEEDVMLRVKAADQMTGQAFNDVGKMGEEGTGVPRRRRSSS